MAEAICSLRPAGTVERHVHAFEEGLYVLTGKVELEVGGRTETPAQDEYAYLEVSVSHELRNPGEAPVRWIEVGSPPPGAPGLDDTVFVGPDFEGSGGEGSRHQARFFSDW